MFGNSDKNRSQNPGRGRETTGPKAGGGKGTVVGTRTGSEAEMRAMSVLENAKSNRHRKTHQVKPGDTGRKFAHLTRGGLSGENRAGVSRDHSSEDAPGNRGVAKGRREQRRRDRQPALQGHAGRSSQTTGRDNIGRHLGCGPHWAGWTPGTGVGCGGRVCPWAWGGER